MVIGLSTSLEKQITDSHLEKIKRSLNNCYAADCDTREKLRNDLKINELEFVYFYCHGRHDTVYQPGGIRSSVTYLEIGAKDRITPEDFNAWSDAYWDPKLHWRSVSPLVFINGCHTTDITPEGLASLVEVFINQYAAGVIGTEISVDQRLAAEVAETFFHHLSLNCTVGESLRAMRFQLLAKGNLLGLAYTPYCSADLRIKRTS